MPSPGTPGTVADTGTAGRTRLTFLGHATFRLTTPEAREVLVLRPGDAATWDAGEHALR